MFHPKTPETIVKIGIPIYNGNSSNVIGKYDDATYKLAPIMSIFCAIISKWTGRSVI
jgi:hypothetical protein